MVVLQKVNQLTNAGFIASVSGGFLEWRPLFETFSAKRLRESSKKAFAAKWTAVATNGLQGFEAIRTDWQERAGGEWKFAETAIGGKQQGYYAVEGSARDATYC